MTRIQIVAIAGSIVFMIFILEIIRRKKLKEAYALIWLIMSVVFLVLSCWVEGLIFFSKKMIGIVYPPAALFLILIVTLIMIMIQFSIVISKHSDKIKSMAQEIALLKARLKKMEEKQDKQ